MHGLEHSGFEPRVAPADDGIAVGRLSATLLGAVARVACVRSCSPACQDHDMHEITLDITTRPVRPADADAINDLHHRVFGPGRFVRTAYRVREGTPFVCASSAGWLSRGARIIRRCA